MLIWDSANTGNEWETNEAASTKLSLLLRLAAKTTKNLHARRRHMKEPQHNSTTHAWSLTPLLGKPPASVEHDASGLTSHVFKMLRL
ncbi:hypothetical protein E2C01_011166 [Portunus trituberculatus]|uniref:Uncharacterized protein n=1 Tax=Portunus trituberculatus TaxID=210409 RepID=A0A5B7DAL6_PORTR|nr:hypothetical protein [Portunus trituberculatus]